MQTKTDGIWHVESVSGSNPKGYCVKHLHSCSPSECSLQRDRICAAPECQFLCPHMYTCDNICYDYNNGYLCKHIHRVHSLFFEVPQEQENSEYTKISDSVLDMELNFAESVFDPHKGRQLAGYRDHCVTIFFIFSLDHTIQLTTFGSLMQELQQTVNPDNADVLPYLPHINALLLRTVTVCRVAEKSTSREQHLSAKDVIPPGKTIDLQWRFKQTAKTPGRKKNGLIFRCMHAMFSSVPCIIAVYLQAC